MYPEITYTEEEYSILTSPYHWWDQWWEDLAEFARLTAMNVNDIVERAWKEIEQCDGKYARVARVYAPLLRQYVDVSPFARDAYRELMLQQTQPFNSVESAYGYVGNGDEVEYVEVDSYTGEVIEDDDQALAGRTAPVVRTDEVAEMICNAYDDDATRQRALNASRTSYTPLDIDSESFTIDRGIASEPIKQIMEQELRLDTADWYEVRNALHPYIVAFNERRSEFFKMANRKKWRSEYRIIKFRQMISKADERNRFLECLQELANKFEPQYIARAFLILQNEDWGLELDDSKLIRLPHWQEAVPIGKTNEIPEDWDRLDRFLDLYADHILEEQGSGRARSGLSEYELLKVCDRLEQEYLANMPLVSDNHKGAQGTASYLAGMLASIHEPDKAKSAGYANWRQARFPQGAKAYDTAFEITGDFRKAWIAFYNAGEIIAVNKNGIKIHKPLADKDEYLSWSLANWRIKRNELYVQPEKLDKLRELTHGRLRI